MSQRGLSFIADVIVTILGALFFLSIGFAIGCLFAYVRL